MNTCTYCNRPIRNIGTMCGMCRNRIRDTAPIEHLCLSAECGDKRKAELRLEAWRKRAAEIWQRMGGAA